MNARRWTQAQRAPERAAEDPSADQVLRAVAARERRVGAASRLIDVLKAVACRNGARVFRLLVELEEAGLTYRTRDEGVQWRWRVSARGTLRLFELAAETKSPAECESAGQGMQVPDQQDGPKVAREADNRQWGEA